MALKCSECSKWGCPNRNLATNECTVESFKTTATNTLKMTREEGIEQVAYRYAVKRQEDPNYPVYNWETEIIDAFIAGVEYADQNPVNYDGKAMLHVLNKGHKQGYKDAIEKACKWLKHNFNMPDDFELHFRKAMEEQR